MRKEIEISGTPMIFEATAMTDHMADKIFGINISYMVQHSQGNEDKMPDMIKKIAFVMHKRAVLGGWRQVENLSEEDYYDWLDQIDSYEIESNAESIMQLYAANKKTSVIPKNVKSPRAGS